MGLNCSHGAWEGSYGRFNRFRQEVARACGVSYPPHYEFNADGSLVRNGDSVVYKKGLSNEFIYFPDGFSDGNPGLVEFFSHSDCDGEISPAMCVTVANELEALLPKMRALYEPCEGRFTPPGDHVERAIKFITGCRAAAAKGVPLRFG